MVIFMIYIGDNTDLSGGNPDFDTLAVDTAGSDALAITWEFHTEEPPDTLAYEIALQEVRTSWLAAYSLLLDQVISSLASCSLLLAPCSLLLAPCSLPNCPIAF